MTTSIHEVLDDLRRAAPNERTKGTLFEDLMVAFLTTDTKWRRRFSRVWRWMDWPGRDGRPDTGIDLVARDGETGGLCAIQCKFYAEDHTVQKGDIDSFFTASGKTGFESRLIITTTDRWSRHAEAALEDQQTTVNRLDLADLTASSIDWSRFSVTLPEHMVRRPPKELWPHQQAALADVVAGLATADRGKLIMACGTGKTLTSLRIVEKMLPVGGSALVLVPSISLLSQTLNEWSTEAKRPLKPYAVCSDTRAGTRTRSEDASPYDLSFPASTSAPLLAERVLASTDDVAITVVFSTYQSLQVVADAQQQGLPRFDLVVCDEAHRTTGVTLAGEDESSFVRIHDPEFVRARKRLYMTATPRIYDDASKAKAGEADATIASMDDPATFGEELHRLGFGDAVTQGLLTDYRVLVLAVNERSVRSTFQHQWAADTGELEIEDTAKIVGCWNGLARRGATDSDASPKPLRRAVAFARDIKTSKRIADLFPSVVDHLVADASTSTSPPAALRCQAEHVDGTFNVLVRNQRLDWLKEDTTAEGDVCRILSNARCLSEGVDVPALDAVMFLNPRNSQVDVVQSVGRVMRLSPGKDYGYIILPIVVPTDVTPEIALRDNKRYRVVWEVLQALRAHDDRFNAMVNTIELNRARDEHLQIIGVDAGGDGSGDGDGSSQLTMSFPDLDEWKDAIYAKIVQRVGQRTYWEDWATDVADIAAHHTERINELLDDDRPDVSASFDSFLEGLRGNLNDSITRADAVDMLAQHLITRPVFDALFEHHAFTTHNPVSLVMQGMLDALDDPELSGEPESLARFYESVRLRAAGIDNAEGKQRIITELYERFFKIAFKRTAESLGIVYTPVEIVDFIIRSVNDLLQSSFGVSIGDRDVHVLDPFTGTGTFIVRLLESGLIDPDDLPRKYAHELHANEILLLAYYIAAINIEATFHGITATGADDHDYVPFGGIVLTDTFQMTEDDDTLDETVFPVNNERAAAQRSLPIRVIIGNPPYSSGQTSQNDANQNLRYPTLDRRIADTYAGRSTATNRNSLYDSYVRAIRWASDRIAENGIVGFVTNGGYIDSNTADGLRQCLAEEFSDLYVFNLRGNQRTSGELSRREGGKVFGSGSRNTVGLAILVKRAGTKRGCLRYRDIGDYLTREQKLAIVAQSTLADPEWTELAPNAEGDWVNQRDRTFDAFLPVGDRDQPALFSSYCRGLQTGRDAWVYNCSSERLRKNVTDMVDAYNGEVSFFDEWCRSNGVEAAADRKVAVNDVIDQDPRRFSWTRADKRRVARGTLHSVRAEGFRQGAYRPFQMQNVYFDRMLNDTVSQLGEFFPDADTDQLAICMTSAGSHHAFTPFMVNCLPNLHILDTSQVFPRRTFHPATGDSLLGPDEFWTDNVAAEAVRSYHTALGEDVSTDDIFFHVYGLLHSSEYRTRFAADLNRTLPRIPMVRDRAVFDRLAAAGRALSDLHVGYETVTPYPLEEIGAESGTAATERYRVRKMRFPKLDGVPDRTRIAYNNGLTLAGIPEEAYRYVLGPRSAIEWVMDRYQVRTDTDSGIVNDPNDWGREHGNPRYVVDLLERVVTVSLETMRIVDALPSLAELGVR